VKVDEWTLLGACRRGLANVIELLLNDKRVNISNQVRQDILSTASVCGYVNVVRLLLNDDRVDKTHKSLLESSADGQIDVVRLLLEDGRFDPTEKKCIVFTEACHNGHLDVALLLFECGRGVKVNADNNRALRFACSNGHEDVVKWLLTFKCVNPLVGRPNSLERAWKAKRANALDILLRDRRVSVDIVRSRLRDYLTLIRPLIESSLLGCVIANSLYGDISLTSLNIIDQLLDQSDKCSELLLFLIMKRLSMIDLVQQIGESDNPEAEAAIRSVLLRSEITHSSSLFTCYRGLLLVSMGYHYVDVLRQLSREMNVTQAGLLTAARVIGAQLGMEKMSLR
jgi:ankyrin repeat protein